MVSTKTFGLFAMCCTVASAQQGCTAPVNGVVTCSFTGPVAGKFDFPVGVDQFTITSFTSGNGGSASDNYISDSAADVAGGRGAALGGTAMINIPSSGFSLPFFVGGNGVDASDGLSVIGPPLSGAGNSSGGSGGGPSYIELASGQYLSLGGAGGGAPCGLGGNAINSTSVASPGYYPGGPGYSYCSGINDVLEQTCAGQGGGLPPSTQGAGGSGTDSNCDQSPAGGDGQANGNGGDALEDDGGGGGGSITGAGGGGTYDNGGGAGNSFVPEELQKAGVTLSQRVAGDNAPPQLIFSYTLPLVTTIISTSNSFTTSTVSLDTSTSVQVSTLPTTISFSTTTQAPMSTSTSVTDTAFSTIRRTKGLAAQTVTVMSPISTVTALSSSTLPAPCTQYEVFYPSSCCPNSWRSLASVTATPAVQKRKILELRELEKRTGSAYTSTTVTLPTGQFGTSSTVTSATITDTTTLSPLTTTTVTSYNPTITSTIVSTQPADTTTLMVSSTGTVTVQAPFAATYTVQNSQTVFVPPTTVTKTVTSTPTTCALQPAATATSCPMVDGHADRTFQRQALATLVNLKNQSGGRQVIVNCGSAGTYGF